MTKNYFNNYKSIDERWKISLVSVVLSIMSTTLFLVLAYYFYKLQGNFLMDKRAIDYIIHIQGKGLDAFFKTITTIGDPSTIIIMSFLIVVLFYYKKLLKDGIYFVVNIIGVWLFNELLKFIFKRERPILKIIEARGYSLPSGHAMVFTAFSLMCVYFISIKIKSSVFRNIGILLIIALNFFVGISRVYLRVHFLSDVIAGWCAGILWSCIGIIIHRYVHYKSKVRLINDKVH
ncbi:phosphatase PAP2 family protein [uncultured Clostridium sp.]|uniref:phosphatase PAP2 family protein n=1 Tax=uncultured Clostridium sp. TaxID=59620 RepID=UPI0028E37D55|nr:phosphatase PAP2 family protein [uncultured Clostridium sp.]